MLILGVGGFLLRSGAPGAPSSAIVGQWPVGSVAGSPDAVGPGAELLLHPDMGILLRGPVPSRERAGGTVGGVSVSA